MIDKFVKSMYAFSNEGHDKQRKELLEIKAPISVSDIQINFERK